MTMNNTTRGEDDSPALRASRRAGTGYQSSLARMIDPIQDVTRSSTAAAITANTSNVIPMGSNWSLLALDTPDTDEVCTSRRAPSSHCRGPSPVVSIEPNCPRSASLIRPLEGSRGERSTVIAGLTASSDHSSDSHGGRAADQRCGLPRIDCQPTIRREQASITSQQFYSFAGLGFQLRAM